MSTGGISFLTVSDVEAYLYHVAVLHGVLFALKTQYPFFPALRYAGIVGDEIIIGHNLRPNEAPRKV